MTLTPPDPTTTGWIVFIAAFGMMCGMEAVDIAALKTWSDMQTPFFVGSVLAHMATVVVAFIGGRLIPPGRNGKWTRRDDPPSP